METDSIYESKTNSLTSHKLLSHAKVAGIALRRYSFLAQLEHLVLPSLLPFGARVFGQLRSQQRGR
jgi:hypothetical protein